MRKQDLFRLCLQNLLRKRSRTFLTVLGVVIGGCSIVIMVSLGIGMKEAQDKLLSQLGDLTIITVTAPQGGRGKVKLDDALVKRLKGLKGAEAVMPRQSLEVDTIRLYAGSSKRYVADWVPIAGLDTSALEPMGFRLTEGENIAHSGDVILGQYAAYNFRDTLRPEGANTVDRWSGGWDDNGQLADPPPAYFDPMKEKLTLELENGEYKATLVLNPVGITKEDYSKGSETSEGILLDLKDLKALAEKLHTVKKGASPYQSILVKATSINQVAELEKQIKALGCATESMESIRQPMEKEARQKQMMLGGLGAISLVVAAIGITNTMIMSISERTKEIGVMKALGCYVRDIRQLFLAEAGVIGLMGGVVSCVISCIAALVANLAAMGGPSPENFRLAILGGEGATRVCVTPPWLLLFAIVFSVFIGLGSGYYPADKAVRIPALEAIKSD